MALRRLDPNDTRPVHHILSADYLAQVGFLEHLFSRASHFEVALKGRTLEPVLKDRIMATLFYEPSTRTRLSFESAMHRLGGQVLTTENAEQFSSAIKGESLEDTVRVIEEYADVIVIRHREQGAARRAAEVSSKPIVNAGDGAGEHPTQALLDLYTINQRFAPAHPLRIALVGDLRYGRTIHSLIYMLGTRSVENVCLVAPKDLMLPDEYCDLLRERKLDVQVCDCLKTAVKQSDVLYMTRIQKERLPEHLDYESVRDQFILTPQIAHGLRDDAIVMHPLPRVNEIPKEIDALPQAHYFQQAKNGLYVRMALLDYLLNGQGKA